MGELIRQGSISMTWQTMETAPTDKPILVYDARLKRQVVAQSMTAVEDGKSDWVFARRVGLGTEALAFICPHPTHWMHLPKNPST